VTRYFFGETRRALCGVYHSPRAECAQDAAVLLCPALDADAARSQRVLRELARRLAWQGQHVLRFDYSGTGESEGATAPGLFVRWMRDIDLALAEIASLSNARHLTLFGVRAGALLAASALASRVAPVTRLALWDPVVSGAGYEARLDDRYPADLRRNVRFTDLRHDIVLPATLPVRLLVTDPQRDVDELERRWGERGLGVSRRALETRLDWAQHAPPLAGGEADAALLEALGATVGGP